MAGDAAAEQYDSSSVTVNNLIDAHRLSPTSFDKKSYMTYIKGYMAKLKKHIEETNPERVQPFMKGAQSFVKTVLGDFKNFELYVVYYYYYFFRAFFINPLTITLVTLVRRWTPTLWSLCSVIPRMVRLLTSTVRFHPFIYFCSIKILILFF